jgi:hypothetical protein
VLKITFFKNMSSNDDLRNGFSLLELIIICGMTVVLTSIFILYSKTGENQFILMSERAKILGAISQAKGLSLQTYTEANSPCGYGVQIDPPTSSYFIFRNGAVTGSGNECDSIKNGVLGGDYTPLPSGDPRDTVFGQVHKLSNGIRFPSTAVAQTILFIPPDPKTIFSPITAGNFTITIETNETSPVEASIIINDFGQISY